MVCFPFVNQKQGWFTLNLVQGFYISKGLIGWRWRYRHPSRYFIQSVLPYRVYLYLFAYRLDWKKYHSLSERLTSLGNIMAQLRTLLKPFNMIVLWWYEGFHVNPYWIPHKPYCQAAVHRMRQLSVTPHVSFPTIFSWMVFSTQIMFVTHVLFQWTLFLLCTFKSTDSTNRDIFKKKFLWYIKKYLIWKYLSNHSRK